MIIFVRITKLCKMQKKAAALKGIVEHWKNAENGVTCFWHKRIPKL